MLVEVLLSPLVLAVAILVAIDVARANTERLREQADGLAHHVAPTIVGASSRGPTEASFREPVRTATPAAAYNAGPFREAERISPAVSSHQQSVTGLSGEPKASHQRRANWSVRSRLALLVSIPAIAVTITAFCVVGLTDVLHGARIHSSSSSARAGAILSALAIGIMLGVVLMLAVWLTIVIAKSVLRPLYRLRASTLAAASAGLSDSARRIGEGEGADVLSGPEPADVDSLDEIGDVARAFQQMRRDMLRMAANEAALHGKLDTMFVNLSHRSQSLAERQIRLIQSLEQREQDRERLASLSRMNRIATRMYRNSQNLLILAGHELSIGWNQPTALVTVVRAAVSEIEEHERVSLNQQPDIAVAGPAVNDVVHMLAELTENATSFSAADMGVEISGHLLNSGGVVIDITDRGVGMSTKDLAYANWRLENPSVTDIDVPKWIGLVVVARLAARHGIRVRLQQAEFGGLTALVWLPDEVITSHAAAVPPEFSDLSLATPRHGSYEAAAMRSAATARSAELTQAWENPRNSLFSRRLIAEAGRRPGPASSTDGARPVSQPGPAATARPSAHGLTDAMDERTIVSSHGSALGDAPTGEVTSGDLGQDRLYSLSSSPSGGTDTSELTSDPLVIAAPSRHEANPAEDTLVVPSAEDQVEERRLPIYDAVESQWFRADARRDVLGSSDVTEVSSTIGSRWSSPADEGWRAAETVESPTSDATTTAGLPRRQPKANLVPGAIPGTEPIALPNRSATAARERLAALQRGVSEGRAAASEAANPPARDSLAETSD